MAVKVLVVDDEKMIVKGLRFSLQQDGYEVECAYDGEEALGMIRERQYDIVLLDVMLPKLSGFEVLQQVREFSDVPVIMLTARGDDMDKILGLDYGADDYVTKPFNPLEVNTAVRCFCRWCGGRIILETSEQSMYISGACAKRLSTMLPNLNMSRQNGESDTISAATKGKKR